ncbi:hypothetical protein [Streptomyces scabiei]|uniref:hypothetical protein n=1 Tax=Streptomyces scabiei TaxID=1930 RepID=UPI0029B30E32|nr:hypothetical protein [Streptomyces scabiei]MDX3127810.1 hypothetical protein [Streptomyces scabiei]
MSGAAAETTKKAMSVVPSEPERRDGAGESSPPAAGAAVASAAVSYQHLRPHEPAPYPFARFRFKKKKNTKKK